MEIVIEICHISVNKQAVQGDRVEDIVELIENGWKYPPIVVRQVENGYILVDGRHRLLAHKMLGITHIRAMVTL